MSSPVQNEVKANILDLLPEHKEYVKENLFDAFFLPEEKLVQIQDLLDEEINMRLDPEHCNESPLKFCPSYIEEVPDGSENGRFLAVDIGGTRCRVLLVDVHNGKLSTKTIKEDLPAELYTGSGVKIFDFIANNLHRLLSECKLLNTPEPLQLGFTFSFPIKKNAVNKAVLMNWTKDYRGNDVIGMEVGQLLQDAITRRGDMNINCCAIINDTIGTLMAGAFIDKGCKIGLICGTGTNGCCLEPIDNCVDYKKAVQTKNKSVALDTRWNNFGLGEEIDYIRSPYDKEIWKETKECNMGIEKMLSGMFIGEVVRRVMLKLHNDSIVFKTWPKEWEKIYGLNTEVVCNILQKDQEISEILQTQGISKPTSLECRLAYCICQLVVMRAAQLSAALLACIVNRVGDPKVGIAVDGSVYKNMTLFSEVLEEMTKSLVKSGTEVYFVPCDDGSGLGAAIVAAMLEKKLHIQKN